MKNIWVGRIIGGAVYLAVLVPSVVIMTAIISVAYGYVIACLWQWFVPWVPAISLPQAIGLAMLVRVFVPGTYVPLKPGKETWTNTARLTLGPLAALLMGYIIHTYFS